MLPDNQSLDDLLGQAPGAVLAWVRHHHAAIHCNQDWQDLAYTSSSTAAINPDLCDDEVLTWVTVAVLVYDRLGEVCPEPSDRYRFTTSGMSFRAFAISKFGPQPGHPVRDPAILENWFFQRLVIPYADAVSMSKNLSNLSTEDFLRISSLKDCIRLMKCVQPQELFCRTEELNRWFELLDTSSG